MSIVLDGKSYQLARLAVLYMTGKWPTFMVDHINGNNRDNRWENLRDVENQVNLQNQRRPKSNNRTGYLGVSWHAKEGRYRATIKFDGKVKHLGYFDDPKAAHAVYVEVKRKVHAGCTL